MKILFIFIFFMNRHTLGLNIKGYCSLNDLNFTNNTENDKIKCTGNYEYKCGLDYCSADKKSCGELKDFKQKLNLIGNFKVFQHNTMTYKKMIKRIKKNQEGSAKKP